MSLSGILLTESPAGHVAPKEGLAPLAMVVPTTRRDFGHADHVSAFVRVYQGGKAPLDRLSASIRIIDTQGVIGFERSATIETNQFGNFRSADEIWELPLSVLASGDYLITFEARRRDATVRSDVRFAVH